MEINATCNKRVPNNINRKFQKLWFFENAIVRQEFKTTDELAHFDPILDRMVHFEDELVTTGPM